MGKFYTLIAGLFLLIVQLYCWSSCHDNDQKPKTQLLEFGLFSIEVPAQWKKTESKEVNSSKGGIRLDSSNQVNFELAEEVDDLNEYVHIIDTTYAFKGMDHAAKVSGNLAKMESLRKSSTTYTMIDGHRAKIITPKQTGIGITGVFIDSLKISGTGLYKFQISGKDLLPKNQQLLLEAIKTLSFIKMRNPAL